MLAFALSWALLRSVSHLSTCFYHENISCVPYKLLIFFNSGYECKSTGNCFEVDLFWNESIYLLPDLAFYCDCGCLLYYANQLLEQGKKFWHTRQKIRKSL